MRWKNGKILWGSNGQIAFDNSCCCGGGGGCSCTPNSPPTVTVHGWESLAACDTCDADGTDPGWDGTLYWPGAACAWWAADPFFDPLSINGYMMDITYTQIDFNPTTCTWSLYIACTSLSNPTKTMWHGTKVGGSTPVGTYNFVDSECGNTGPATMTVTTP